MCSKILSLRLNLTDAYVNLKEVVTRRAQFDKEKAEACDAHVLEGLLIARHSYYPVPVKPWWNKNSAVKQVQAFTNVKSRSKPWAYIVVCGLERDSSQNMAEVIAYGFELIFLQKPERCAKSSRKSDEVKRKFGDKRRTELMVGEVLTRRWRLDCDVLITLSNKRLH